jgi:hypothetical protein
MKHSHGKDGEVDIDELRKEIAESLKKAVQDPGIKAAWAPFLYKVFTGT